MTCEGQTGGSDHAADPVPHVQTKREIEATLISAGLRPRRRLGQHFLIDGNLMRRLVDTADIRGNDTVLEVGAGTGGLTDLLAGRARRVISVEVDRDLFSLLEDRFVSVPNVTLLNTDVLERKHRIAPEVIECLFDKEYVPPQSVKLVANLPYHVATPILMNLLLDHPEVTRFVFTVQSEVGERLLAGPGSRDFGPLAIITQTLSQSVMVTRLPPHVFWPQPEVDSVMIRMDAIAMPFVDRTELHRFAAFVRGVFEHRRKTLNSALRYVVDDEVRTRIGGLFDATQRPETFSREEWLAMFAAIS